MVKHFNFYLCQYYFRIDERKLLVGITLVASVLGRLLFFPIPDFPTSPLCINQTIVDKTHDQFFNTSNEMDHWLSTNLNFSSFNNVACDGNRMSSNGKEEIEMESRNCCPFDWCKHIPAITVPQFIVGWVIGTLGYAYSTAFTIALISKMIGPKSQVGK